MCAPDPALPEDAQSITKLAHILRKVLLHHKGIEQEGPARRLGFNCRYFFPSENVRVILSLSRATSPHFSTLGAGEKWQLACAHQTSDVGVWWILGSKVLARCLNQHRWECEHGCTDGDAALSCADQLDDSGEGATPTMTGPRCGDAASKKTSGGWLSETSPQWITRRAKEVGRPGKERGGDRERRRRRGSLRARNKSRDDWRTVIRQRQLCASTTLLESAPKTGTIPQRTLRCPTKRLERDTASLSQSMAFRPLGRNGSDNLRASISMTPFHGTSFTFSCTCPVTHDLAS